MAKYQIYHTCGHLQEHQILGTNAHGERDNTESWLATTLCTDCWRAEQIRKMSEKNAAWATLVGSEKQIAWAMKIRGDKYPAMLKLGMAARMALEQVEKAIAEQWDSVVEKIGFEKAQAAADAGRKHYSIGLSALEEAEKNMASAKWWIDHR